MEREDEAAQIKERWKGIRLGYGTTDGRVGERDEEGYRVWRIKVEEQKGKHGMGKSERIAKRKGWK
jgi:hypothetical protein